MNTKLGFASVAVLIALAIAIIAGGAYVILRPGPQAPASNFEVKLPDKSQLASTGLQTFASERLGISFSYSPVDPLSTGREIKTRVLEKGNIVYVYQDLYEGAKPEDGQWIEVFDKGANESFADAIRRVALAGYPSKDCRVEVKKARETFAAKGYEEAHITYPIPESTDPNFDSIGAMWKASEQCNPKYAETNGVRFFLYDPEHPTKFFFFSIGQYGIMAGKGKSWQDTFRVLGQPAARVSAPDLSVFGKVTYSLPESCPMRCSIDGKVYVGDPVSKKYIGAVSGDYGVVSATTYCAQTCQEDFLILLGGLSSGQPRQLHDAYLLDHPSLKNREALQLQVSDVQIAGNEVRARVEESPSGATETLIYQIVDGQLRARGL